MAAAWRLLLDAAGDGAWNMGVDEALLASAVASGTPVLRLYRWRGPWLSLGYAQRLSAARRAALAGAGVGVVRRVTGGQAVLHGADLTYALAAPTALLPPGLRASYERVGAALADALASLGVAVERAAREARAAEAPFDCFARPAGDELCVAGRKLVGSAQRRVDGGVLQHGSIRLGPDRAALSALLGFAAGDSTSLAEEGFRGSFEEACEAVVAAFSRHLGARFQPARPSPEELAAAATRGLEPPARASAGPTRAPQGPSRVHLAGR